MTYINSTAHETTQELPPQYIDSSMLSSWSSCPRSYYWSYVKNLRSPGRNIHLTAGSAFAAGCDAARRAAFAGGTTSDIELEAFKAFSVAWGQNDLAHDATKSFVNTFDSLITYLQQYPPLTDVVQPLSLQSGGISTEFTFAVPLPVAHPSGDPYMLTGRFDMLATYNGGQLVVVDEKTTSGVGPYWVNQWQLRGQFLAYCWALQQLGYNVDTIVVRGISILKTNTQVMQAVVQYPAWIIDRWFTETCHKLRSINWAASSGQWHYNLGPACSSYGGCQFTTLCIAKDPSKWISNYVVEVWDPLRK